MTGRWGTRTVPGEEVSPPAAVAGAGGGGGGRALGGFRALHTR